MQYVIFRVVRLSGLLFVIEALFTALGTGQAEVSYKFWGVGQFFVLLAIITARVEHRWIRHKEKPIEKSVMTGDKTSDFNH